MPGLPAGAGPPAGCATACGAVGTMSGDPPGPTNPPPAEVKPPPFVVAIGTPVVAVIWGSAAGCPTCICWRRSYSLALIVSPESVSLYRVTTPRSSICALQVIWLSLAAGQLSRLCIGGIAPLSPSHSIAALADAGYAQAISSLTDQILELDRAGL